VKDLVLAERIENRIYFIRGQKVMVDKDLAELYGVPTKVLNQSVKRNIKRFPEDFMFQLTLNEKTELVTNCDQFKTLKHSTVNPYAFTEQGVAMLSSVLNSERAIYVNIQIMRTFMKLKLLLATHKDLQRKIEEMEKKYDQKFRVVFDAIRALITLPEPKRKKIGFL